MASPEEMNAIVDKALLWGHKACAHAHGTMAIKMAVKAGVSSIEHSYADIIAVTTDPLKDITVLEKVSFVMKGGTVYK